MTPENDIGQDGFVPSSGRNGNQFLARDVFALLFSYFNQDYVNLAKLLQKVDIQMIIRMELEKLELKSTY